MLCLFKYGLDYEFITTDAFLFLAVLSVFTALFVKTLEFLAKGNKVSRY